MRKSRKGHEVTSLRNAVTIAITNCCLAVVLFVISVVLARALGPEGHGKYSSLVSWPSWICLVALLGVHTFLARQAAILPQNRQQNYRIGLSAIAVLGAAAFVLFNLAIQFEWTGVRHADPALALLASLMIPFGMGTAFQAEMERALMNYFKYNVVRSAFILVFAALLLLAWLFFAINVTTCVVSFVLANIAAFAISQVTVRSHLTTTGSSESLQSFRVLLQSARSFALLSSVYHLSIALDWMLVSIFLSHRDMGLYMIALIIAQVPDIFTTAVSTQFFGRIAAYGSLKAAPGEWLSMRLRQFLLFNLVLTIVTMMAAPLVIRVFFGDAFASSSWLAQLLLPVIFMRSGARACEEVLKGAGLPQICTKIRLLTIVLLAITGGYSVAIAGSLPLLLFFLLAVNSLQFVLMLVAVTREAGLPFGACLWPRRSDLREFANSLRQLRQTRGGE